MNSLPFTTKILLGILLFVAGRFVYTLISNPSPQTLTPSSKTTPSVDSILTCAEYTKKIQSCTEQAMACLQQIAKSKNVYEENEQKIDDCQSNNQKNLQLNNELRIKLETVTKRLDDLRKNRSAPKSDNTQTSSEL